MKSVCKGPWMLVLPLLLLLAAALAAPPEAEADFGYRKPITIDRTNVGNAGAPTTLASFPFLYNVTDANLKTVANGGHVSNPSSGSVISIDGTPTSAAATTAQTTLTWSHTTGAGTDRILLVGVSIRNLGGVTVQSVTYNNINLSLAGPGSATNGTVVRAELWKLVAPPTGTFNVVVTLTAAQRMAAGAISLTGVDQTTPIGTSNSATGISTTPSVTVTTVADNAWVVDVLAFRRGTGGPTEPTGTPTGAGQTQRWSAYMDSADTADMRSKGSTVGPTSPAGAVAMSWSLSASQDWAHYAVSLKPAGAGTAGADIIFRAFDADNPGSNICGVGIAVCTLDHEIEQYEPTTGKLVAWVGIPVLNTQTASSNTLIYIYYGDSGITTSTENPTGVWDSNFEAVWHMNQDPSVSTDCAGGAGTKELCDSTTNNHDADSFGTMTSTDLVSEPTAKVGKAIDFDGTDDRFEVPSPNLPTGDFTYSLWVTSRSFSSSQTMFTANSTVGPALDEFNDQLRSTSQNRVFLHAVSTAVGSANTTNTYYYLTAVRSGSSVTLYKNAASDATGTNSTVLNFGTCQLLISAEANSGCNATLLNFVNGITDELRISKTARDVHWIKTEYNNMSSPSTFCTPACGTATEESNPPSAVRLRGARAIAYEGAFAQTVQLKWRTSHEVDHLGFHVYREQAGQLLRLTPSLVAGSVLLAHGRTELTAGQRYSWWDVLPMGGGPLQYWLEEIDLHGQRTWHGPIAVTSAKGRRDLAKPEQVRSVLLSKLGRGKGHRAPGGGRLPGAPWQGAADAATQTPTAAQLAVQAQLAAGPAIKLGVSAEGWYRVDQPTLIAAGLDPKVDPRRLKLFADGREVPLVVTGERDGRFDARDTIEFYGLGLDTPWTDTRTYWLVEGPQAGQRIEGSEWRGRTEAGPASFPFTVAWQPRELYFAALRNGEADNFFGPVVTSWPTEQAFTLNHLDPAPRGTARLEVTLQGVTDGPHAVDVQVNGTSVGTVSFDGQRQGQANLSVPADQLVEGANLVTLVALGGEMDVSLVATVRLTYWHTYTAEEDVLRGSVPAGQAVTIGGFSTRPIHVLDITQPDAVRAVPGRVSRQGSSFAVTVVGPGPGTRTLLAFTDRIAATPAKIYANQPSRWQARGQRADLVMIGHPTFLPSLATLKAWREQQGWTVALIDVEDLYDEFTFGAKSPWALRALMETARKSWAQPPRFLLLAGDASFDPRDFQAMGETDFVPTKLIDTDMMETASDDWFGDLNGDGVAEVAVGRLAVRTAEEAATVVQKLIGYDQTAAARTAVLVADTPDSLDFEGASTRLAALLPSGMATQAIYRSQSDDATTRGTLLAALNSGAWLVNYLGHGSVEVWRGEVFTSQDASTLTNGMRLPFVSTMTCLNGFFHDVYTESLAEALQRAPQGGAIAVWASSSLSEAAEQINMNRRLLQGLSAGLTLGDAVAQAKAVARDPDVRRTWILFGDPTTRLK